jgi:hypothetical protein
MTALPASVAVLDMPQATAPRGPVFLSRNGRRGRVLAPAGCFAATGAALWIVALVAGALGVATPGLLHLPGVRRDAPVGSVSQGPGGGGRPPVAARRLPAPSTRSGESGVARARVAASRTVRHPAAAVSR